MNQNSKLKFFIVTPTFNSLRWLPGCIASVARQASEGNAVDGCQLIVDKAAPATQQLNCSKTPPAISVQHHVQDGGSTDGTVEFLKEYVDKQPSTDNYQLTFASEADKGMYDAINKGWERAEESVDWLGHLNSDEQYQPGVLARIAQAGRAHPSWGAVTGNCIWVDEPGNYLCSRKPSVGWPWVGRIWIPASTCALFIRRKFYGKDRARFDISWKSFGDKVFCRDLLNAGCKFGYLDDYMALFIHRGTENLGFQPVTEVERARYWNEELGSMERRFAPVSIFAAKASRVLRNRFGKPCRSYVWITPDGSPKQVAVDHNRWTI
jgi:glycosyltransferase involved in cell wall biosynthesis